MGSIQEHPFSHLGPAPYRFAGCVDISEKAEHDAVQREALASELETLPAVGSCDHCGTAITVAYRFQAADGTRFKVGESCANKAYKEAKQTTKAQQQFEAAVRKRKRDMRKAREAAKIAETVEIVAKNREKLANHPSPNEWRAAKGDTLADWCDWMLTHAGNAGKITVGKVVRKTLNKTV